MHNGRGYIASPNLGGLAQLQALAWSLALDCCVVVIIKLEPGGKGKARTGSLEEERVWDVYCWFTILFEDILIFLSFSFLPPSPLT